MIFLVYKDTIEEARLQRMGAKMKHAMLLYGDEASGSLIEADEDDLQRDLFGGYARAMEVIAVSRKRRR